MPIRDMSKLQAVATLAHEARSSRQKLMDEAMEEVRLKMAVKIDTVNKAVMEALDAGHSISAVARAYTPPGSTPNRNRIYEIKKAYANVLTANQDGYPFEWRGRTVSTVKGDRTVYDVHAVLDGFGPDDVVGEFVWRWDKETEELEPVLSSVFDPYPTTAYYAQMLSQWLAINPYPGD